MGLFNRSLAFKEECGLVVMFGKLLRVAAYLVFVHGRWKRDKAFKTCLERAPARQRIRLVGHPATVNCLAMYAVALVVVDLSYGRIDGNLMEVWAAQAGQLGVQV